jgi:hypothetical protein
MKNEFLFFVMGIGTSLPAVVVASVSIDDLEILRSCDTTTAALVKPFRTDTTLASSLTASILPLAVDESTSDTSCDSFDTDAADEAIVFLTRISSTIHLSLNSCPLLMSSFFRLALLSLYWLTLHHAYSPSVVGLRVVVSLAGAEKVLNIPYAKRHMSL